MIKLYNQNIKKIRKSRTKFVRKVDKLQKICQNKYFILLNFINIFKTINRICVQSLH